MKHLVTRALARLRRHGAVDKDRDRLAATMPMNPVGSDLYLVAFPKSGVTWLSFLLANVNLLLSGEQQRRATLFNISDLIPDIHTNRNLSNATTAAPGFRVIKSHSGYHPGYTKVLLLVRHPIHVMASYYVYSTALNQFTGSIEDMVEDEHLGINAWVRHTAGWLDKARPEISFRLIRYEDFLTQPSRCLRELYELWGIDVSDDIISTATERSNLTAMAADEQRFNAGHPALSGFEFVRRREDREPRCLISDVLRARILDTARPITERLGYECHGKPDYERGPGFVI
ncbi:sulfotransferase domain-containing protein [Bradyrhizobium sp. ORS 111]|uniref:sulfotransferase domain-containing protein n=1 Tax=Bradyrhizobium sp. ORS 111 TaxID=1685958 RepID=UPI00388D072F